jgi:hypothetical protein
MLALWKVPKQKKEREECSMENKLQISLRMKDIQLIWEKDEKYGKTHKRLVKLIAIS